MDFYNFKNNLLKFKTKCLQFAWQFVYRLVLQCYSIRRSTINIEVHRDNI